MDYRDPSSALTALGRREHWKARPIQRSTAILQRVPGGYWNLQGFRNRLKHYIVPWCHFPSITEHTHTKSSKQTKKWKAWRFAEFVKYFSHIAACVPFLKKIPWSSFLQVSYGFCILFERWGSSSKNDMYVWDVLWISTSYCAWMIL